MYLIFPLKYVDTSKLETDLISEIELSPIQAKTYLLVNLHGKMSSLQIAEKLKILPKDAQKSATDLMTLGAFIDISETEFEAMHPRFTSVNMYRKKCERKNIEFKRNKIVDNIGVILEPFYDDARTK
jgi:hypothetical protein